MDIEKRLRSAGFNDDEINAHISSEESTLRKAGFNDDEINSHFGRQPVKTDGSEPVVDKRIPVDTDMSKSVVDPRFYGIPEDASRPISTVTGKPILTAKEEFAGSDRKPIEQPVSEFGTTGERREPSLLEKGLDWTGRKIDVAAKGLIGGTLGLAETVGTGLQWAGHRVDSETLADMGKISSEYWGEKAEKFVPPENIAGKNVIDNPELLADSSWWIYNISNMIPALAATVIPGLGAAKVAKGIQLAGKAVKLSPAVVARLAKLGQYLPAGMVGGALEGAQTYKQVLQEGAPEETAARAGELMSLGAGVLNALGVGKILKKAGQGFKAKIIKQLGAAAWEGMSEAAEEPTEVFAKYTAKYLTGEELPSNLMEQLVDSLKAAATVAPVAAVTGGGVSVISGIKSRDILLAGQEKDMTSKELLTGEKELAVTVPKEEPIAPLELEPIIPDEVKTLSDDSIAKKIDTLEKTQVDVGLSKGQTKNLETLQKEIEDRSVIKAEEEVRDDREKEEGLARIEREREESGLAIPEPTISEKEIERDRILQKEADVAGEVADEKASAVRMAKEAGVAYKEKAEGLYYWDLDVGGEAPTTIATESLDVKELQEKISETKKVFEAVKPTREVAPEEGEKEPWELSKKEFDTEYKKGNISQIPSKQILQDLDWWKDNKAVGVKMADVSPLDESAAESLRFHHVTKALREGKSVSAEVLAEYPELVPVKPLPSKLPEAKPSEAYREDFEDKVIPRVTPKVEKREVTPKLEKILTKPGDLPGWVVNLSADIRTGTPVSKKQREKYAEFFKDTKTHAFDFLRETESLSTTRSRLIKNIKSEKGSSELISDMSRLGTDLIRRGYTSFKVFSVKMKNILGDTYVKVKN